MPTRQPGRARRPGRGPGGPAGPPPFRRRRLEAGRLLLRPPRRQARELSGPPLPRRLHRWTRLRRSRWRRARLPRRMPAPGKLELTRRRGRCPARQAGAQPSSGRSFPRRSVLGQGRGRGRAEQLAPSQCVRGSRLSHRPHVLGALRIARRRAMADLPSHAAACAAHRRGWCWLGRRRHLGAKPGADCDAAAGAVAHKAARTPVVAPEAAPRRWRLGTAASRPATPPWRRQRPRRRLGVVGCSGCPPWPDGARRGFASADPLAGTLPRLSEGRFLAPRFSGL